MPLDFVTKQDAIALIRVEAGYGRRIIEKMLDKLKTEGRISRDDIDIVSKVLKREIE